MALLARDEKLSPPLTGQYLCVPGINAVPERFKDENISREANVNDPVLNMKGFKVDLKAILAQDNDSFLFSPFNHPKGHKGVAPAYLQICGLDPLRDEGLLYERMLREENGVPTKLDLYPGFGHYFWTNFPTLEMSRKFIEDTGKGARWLVEQAQK